MLASLLPSGPGMVALPLRLGRGCWRLRCCRLLSRRAQVVVGRLVGGTSGSGARLGVRHRHLLLLLGFHDGHLVVNVGHDALVLLNLEVQLGHASVGARHQLLRVSLELSEAILGGLNGGPESSVHGLHRLAEIRVGARKVAAELSRRCLAVSPDSAQGIPDHLRLALQDIQAACVVVGTLNQPGEDAMQLLRADSDPRVGAPMGRRRLPDGDPCAGDDCAEAGGQPGSQLRWPGECAIGGVLGTGCCAACPCVAMACELKREV